ncbi:SRPBCC domain-containing protein [Brachybacterium saurashtrense]|uniref:Polyketide cyclase n=1 Tax=Brachybacterium saurashtrense TaxID=556288 RepID=A0A345YR31_9MICO|nr:SRPBCC domain-containing protein [Brachybacterium saurashtrense]AXK46383.1 polyketide cyclase [Brachybacterium saurashtrense]RRR24124.1 polyketide cyclase [Brachybacterium saurashtrense]
MSTETTPLTTDDVPDEIVRSIHVHASAETVFEVISEPGWFINDGEYRAHEIRRDGATATVIDPVLGEFQVGVVELDPRRRAVFRWLAGASGSLEEHPATTVEFGIEPDDDGVRLTVRETGFAGISADAAERRARFESNDSGWLEELGVAKTQAERQ